MGTLIKTLNDLKDNFPIEWDRFTQTEDFYFVFGWIKRTDGQRDFIVLEHWEKDNVFWHATSSAKYSNLINDFLNGEDSGHISCRKIDELNSIIK